MSVFKQFTVKDLKTLCKIHNIKKYSKLKKQPLIDLLENVEEPSKDYKILLLFHYFEIIFLGRMRIVKLRIRWYKQL